MDLNCSTRVFGYHAKVMIPARTTRSNLRGSLFIFKSLQLAALIRSGEALVLTAAALAA